MVAVSILLTLSASASTSPAEQAYLSCTEEKVRQAQDVEQCLDEVGRHAWYPLNEAICAGTAGILEWAFAQGQDLSYKLLFFNERCARLGHPHFVADGVRAPPPVAATEVENPFGSFEEQQRTLSHRDTSLYNDPEGEFSIDFPANWRVIEARETVTKVKIASPLDATCAVVIDQVTMDPENTIKDVIEIMRNGGYKGAVETRFGEVEMLQADETRLNNRPGFLAVYSFSYKTLNYDLRIIVSDTMTWIANRVFKVSCAAEERIATAHARLFELITASFVIHRVS
jgi:hypothetical protein